MSKAKMRKIRRIKASVKHPRKIHKGRKQKVSARKKKSQSVVAKTDINLNQPGALTRKSVAQLIASASDKTHTQLRVTKDGLAVISTRVGADAIDDLAFRLETFSAGTDHVGPAAAQDAEWVNRIYKVLKDNWPIPSSSYIDFF
jgi:hypothetical protein